MSDEALIIRPNGEEPDKRVEICRSFSYRVSLSHPDGRPTYEHADFFASIKQECAAEDAEETSAAAYDFCESQVRRGIATFSKRRAARAEKRSA